MDNEKRDILSEKIYEIVEENMNDLSRILLELMQDKDIPDRTRSAMVQSVELAFASVFGDINEAIETIMN